MNNKQEKFITEYLTGGILTLISTVIISMIWATLIIFSPLISLYLVISMLFTSLYLYFKGCTKMLNAIQIIEVKK